MMAGQLGIAVAVNLVDGARHFAALDVGAADVIGGTDQRASQCLDPVTVDHNKIGFMFCHKVRKPHDCLGQNHILGVVFALIEEFVHGDTNGAVHLKFSQPVAL